MTADVNESAPRSGRRLRPALRRLLLSWRFGCKEYLQFDARWLHRPAGLILFHLGWLAARFGFHAQALELYSKLHRAAFSPWVDERITADLRVALASGHQVAQGFRRALQDNVDGLKPIAQTAKLFDDPRKVLRSNLLVIKRATTDEKGLIVLQYSHYFPLLQRLFDTDRLCERYYLVVEPSWSGFCDPDVLSLCLLPAPVFVSAGEPRDAAFLRGLGSNLVPIDVSTNWWIDHEVMSPEPGKERCFDICMVAGWGLFKRHYQFFAALKRARDAGCRWRVALVGYKQDIDLATVKEFAALHGIEDQITWFDYVPQEEVARILSQSRCFVLWSRREGLNRAIVEAMLADVPVIVREGFNYGARYAHINPATGCYASEQNLPDEIQRVLGHLAEFAPRDWVLSNMRCDLAAQRLGQTVREVAESKGESFSGTVVAKVNRLNAMSYWQPEVASDFEDDYRYLETLIR